MSNQEDKFDFSDIQKTIDSVKEEALRQVDVMKEEALKQVDWAKEEATKQMDKAREEASKQADRAKTEASKQFDKAMEGAARQFDRFKNYRASQDDNAYIELGHGRKVISGKLKKNPGLYSGPAEIAVGAAGVGAFGGAGLGFGIGAALGAATVGMPIALGTAATLIPLTIISALLLGKGIFSSRRARRVKEYSRIWTGKQYVMIEDIEDKVKWDRKRILKDIHFLTQRDLIIGAELDEGETCLMLTDESKQQYKDAMNAKKLREQEEEKKRELEEAMENAAPKEREVYRIKKEGEQCLKQLGDMKLKIQSAEVKEKISQMEVRAARIFVSAAEHPESISQTDKWFKYYFPSVMKLLTVYKDMEKQPVQGENIQKTRREIEESLDTMNTALEKLFDEMFQNVAMDISSDIQVLEVMLKQDGLTEGEMHAGQTEPMLKL